LPPLFSSTVCHESLTGTSCVHDMKKSDINETKTDILFMIKNIVLKYVKRNAVSLYIGFEKHRKIISEYINFKLNRAMLHRTVELTHSIDTYM